MWSAMPPKSVWLLHYHGRKRPVPPVADPADWGILTVLAFLIRLDGNLRSKPFRGGNRRPPRAADQARCDGSGHSSVGTFALSHLE